jgi:hypothetical protein
VKNQYFGDVNDYRKYGLLRLLSGNGKLPIGVCWMLTPDDERTDGEKIEYLEPKHSGKYRFFDPDLYDSLQNKLANGSRNIGHFDSSLLPNSSFWSKVISDDASERSKYFSEAYDWFSQNKSELVFYDPDDGLANLGKSKHPMKPSKKYSSKKIFSDEIKTTIHKGMSVLLYQHFIRETREKFVARLGKQLASYTAAQTCFSFWTPHVVFFLIPTKPHLSKVSTAVDRVAASEWCKENSCKTSKSNGKKQISCGKHLID